jgi:hypothetical protein
METNGQMWREEGRGGVGGGGVRNIYKGELVSEISVTFAVSIICIILFRIILV